MNFNEQIQIDHSPESLYSTRTARVYRAEHKGRGLVAVKILWENAAPGRLLQLTIRESWTWSQLHHDHIVPLWGVADVSQIATGFGFEPQLCMISPWMIEGNIMGFLKRNPDANRLRLLWDIVKGVDYLHSFKPHKIIHGDLKGNNVLVDIVDGCPRARLTDFGLSYAIQELCDQQFSDSTTTAYRGNPRWLAFERLDPVKFGAINAQDAHSTQSDVFEMMRTFLQVLTGQEPFHDITNEMAVINKVHQGSNPLRPSGPINGLNEAMWNLMVLSWNHDRMERPSLSVIWETMETFVLEDALLTVDVQYLQKLHIGDIVVRLANLSNTASATPILLLRCLRMILETNPERFYSCGDFDSLVVEVIRYMRQSLDFARRRRFEGAFCFLAQLSRSVSGSTLETLRSTVHMRLPVSFVVQGLSHLDSTYVVEFQATVQLILRHISDGPDGDDLTLVEDILLYIFSLIDQGEVASHATVYLKELLKDKLVHGTLIARLCAPASSTAWPAVFCHILDWLLSQNDSASRSILDQMLLHFNLASFLEHISPLEDVSIPLRAVTLILEIQHGRARIEGKHMLKILPLLHRELERLSDLSSPQWCLRLLRVSAFYDAFSNLMGQSTSLDPSTLVCLAELLKTASLRLLYDPFDKLFSSLHKLPWISLACRPLSSSHLRSQLVILQSLASGRTAARATDPERGSSIILPLPAGFSLYEAGEILPVLAGAFGAVLDMTSIFVCVDLLKHEAFGSIFLKAFTTGDTTDQQFAAATRIWLVSWSKWQAIPFLSVDNLRSHVPLDSQVHYVDSIRPHSAEESRLYPLLRVLASRLNQPGAEKLSDVSMFVLISCLSRHLCCQWVASEHNIGDLVQNTEILRGAFDLVKSKKLGHVKPEARLHAIEVIVAAYRVTEGRNNGLQSMLFNLGKLDVEFICSAVHQLNDQSLAVFWEFMLYRIRLEDKNTPRNMFLPTLVAQALEAIPYHDDEAAYVALLVLQCAYDHFVGQGQATSRYLSIDKTQWLDSHKMKTESASHSAPLSKSAGKPVQVDAVLLRSFRQRLQRKNTRGDSSDTTNGG